MVITIGEIVNEILPFSNQVTSSIVNGFPYVNAPIRGSGSCPKIYVSVVQFDNHVYAAAVTDDVFNGNKFIPTGNSSKPFIREKYFMRGNEQSADRIVSRIQLREFHSWWFKQLYDYGVICFNPDNLTTQVRSLGFNSLKIRRTLERMFSKNHCRFGNIEELINLVNNQKKSFDLTNLLDKELSCVNAKLRNLGLLVTIKDGYIINIDYERKG